MGSKEQTRQHAQANGGHAQEASQIRPGQILQVRWRAGAAIRPSQKNRISKYEFSTLEKGKADEYPGNTLLYRTMQRELSMPFAEYKPVVKYDLSQHEVWCDNRLEGGDLRTREAICACDRCLESR